MVVGSGLDEWDAAMPFHDVALARGVECERNDAVASLTRIYDAALQGKRPCVAVSACLLGKACRFDATARPSDSVRSFVASIREMGCTVVPVCPECMGGLRRPRPPAEMQADGRVVDKSGKDVSEAFARGSDKTLRTVQAKGVVLAVLKAKSPSCGCHEVFDGTFTGRLVRGRGVAAARMVEAGVLVADEIDVERFYLSNPCLTSGFTVS